MSPSLPSADAAPSPARTPLLMFRPLSFQSVAPLLVAYALGLNDELGHRLYQKLSAFRHVDPEVPLAALTSASRAVLLEGTVRELGGRVCVSLLLRGVRNGAVLWYQQFDAVLSAGEAGHVRMAERCVAALLAHLPS